MTTSVGTTGGAAVTMTAEMTRCTKCDSATPKIKPVCTHCLCEKCNTAAFTSYSYDNPKIKICESCNRKIIYKATGIKEYEWDDHVPWYRLIDNNY